MRIALYLIVVSSLLVGSVLKAEPVWKIASLNWEPYSGAALLNQGYAIQTLSELLDQHGIRLDVEFYPWARAKLIARQKGFIGYFPAWPEEVEEGFVASPRFAWSEIGVIRNTRYAVQFDSISQLFSRYSVGMVESYVYPEVINQFRDQRLSPNDLAQNEITLLRKLAVGRHQVAITDPKVMHYLAEAEGVTNIKTVHILMNKELVVALRDEPDNQEVIDQLREIWQRACLNRSPLFCIDKEVGLRMEQ